MRRVFALITGSLLCLCVVKSQAEEDQAYKRLMKDASAAVSDIGKTCKGCHGAHKPKK